MSGRDRLEQATGTAGLGVICLGVLVVGGGMALIAGTKMAVERSLDRIRIRVPGTT